MPSLNSEVKQRAAVVVLNQKNVLLMHRFSGGKEYYIFPGGGIEEGETPEAAAVREAFEETGLTATLGEKLWQYHNTNFYNRTEHFFLVSEYEGNLKLGGEEAIKNSVEDSYEIVWLPLVQLKWVTFFPEEIKEKTLQRFLNNK